MFDLGSLSLHWFFWFLGTYIVVNKVYYRQTNTHKFIYQRIWQCAKIWGTAIESGKLLLSQCAISLHLATFSPSQSIGARRPVVRMLTANAIGSSFCHSTGRWWPLRLWIPNNSHWLFELFRGSWHFVYVVESLHCFAVNIYTSIRYRLGLLT